MLGKTTDLQEIGFVISSQDYLVFLEGLPSCRLNDVIVNSKGDRAIITALEEEKIEAWLLEGDNPKPGDTFTVSVQGLRFALKYSLFGWAINRIGKPLDGKPSLPPGGEEIDLDALPDLNGCFKRKQTT